MLLFKNLSRVVLEISQILALLLLLELFPPLLFPKHRTASQINVHQRDEYKAADVRRSKLLFLRLFSSLESSIVRRQKLRSILTAGVIISN